MRKFDRRRATAESEPQDPPERDQREAPVLQKNRNYHKMHSEVSGNSIRNAHAPPGLEVQARAYDELCLLRRQLVQLLNAAEDATCADLATKVRELRRSAGGEYYRVVEYYRQIYDLPPNADLLQHINNGFLQLQRIRVTSEKRQQ